MLTRARILELLPHQGAMCLLDEVESWSTDDIRCVATRHRDPTHPLRRGGMLAAVHLIEYAGQCAALHGALAASADGRPPIPGLLAAVRDVELFARRLDDIDAPIGIRASRLLGGPGGFMYGFEATASDRLLGRGRFSVILPKRS
ncbi:MAG: phosphotransferase [Panacagrimonas sp.]|nr:hypothetical protein [Panacagrimonas sp.]MCC2657801.1 phosphotransferase [Panacagrimonas sp.]